MSARPFTTLALVALLPLACQSRDGSLDGQAADSPRVAEISGRTITLQELEDWIKEEAWRREMHSKSASQRFDLHSTGLREMLEQIVLEEEAERRGVSSEALIEAEVTALGPVTDEEIQGFFAANAARLGGRTLEQLTPSIRQHFQGQKREQVLTGLRESASIEVFLERPRLEVAADGPSKGPEDAAITIVEFSDFECPFCKRAGPVIDAVLERYPEDVRVVYRHLPLAMHKRARPAAEAAACAHEQGQFWAYHDKLFENGRKLGDEDFDRYATELGLDSSAFAQCFSDGRFRQKVESDAAAARAVGITGTPAFVVNGVLISGAKPVEAFVEVIDAELAAR